MLPYADRPLPAHALVLYLWSLKLLHRTLLQSQQVQNVC
jgi:hypothetical protein